MNDPTTINAWLSKPGPIHLRQAERKDTRKVDAICVEGIILTLAITGGVCAWVSFFYILLR